MALDVFGFTMKDVKQGCVVCCEVLSSESMKPSKLIRLFETKHSYLKHIPVKFIQRYIKALNDQQTSIFKVTRVSK
jgi:hypothetical protein